MFDLSLVSGFDWDDGNRLKSANKHSVSMAEAEQVFADSGLLLAEDVKIVRPKPVITPWAGRPMAGRCMRHLRFAATEHAFG
jgi:hypothetical protein